MNTVIMVLKFKERFSDLRKKFQTKIKKASNWKTSTKIISAVATLAVCSVIIYLTVLAFKFFGGVGDTVGDVLGVGKTALDGVVNIGKATGSGINEASKPFVKRFEKWLYNKYLFYKAVKPVYSETLFGLDPAEFENNTVYSK